MWALAGSLFCAIGWSLIVATRSPMQSVEKPAN